MFQSRTNRKCRESRPLLAGCVILAATAPFVLGYGADEKPLQRAELLLLESSSSAMTVGLHIGLAPGWHLYWVNPGDAGLAPEVIWKLPAGYEAGPLRYPVPEKIVSGDIVAYGFTNEALILCEIRFTSVEILKNPPAIACRLDWMACRESCVTGREDIEVSATAQTPAGKKMSGEIVSRFAHRFPKMLDERRIVVKAADLVKQGNKWQLEVQLSGKDAARVSDFFPHPPENFVIAHNRIAVSRGKVIIPLEPSGPSATLTRIEGLLIFGDDAYEVLIPVKKQ